MLFNYLIAFLAGLATKFTDNLVDEPFLFNEKIKYASALAYGILGGYLISFSSEFATLFLGVVASVFLAGKIDSGAHQLALVAMIATIAFFGLPAIVFPFFLSLLLFGFLDELLNNFADKRTKSGLELPGPIQRFARGRFGLEIAALGLSIATGNWIYFLGLISFDIGYNAVERLLPLASKPTQFFPAQGASFDCFECDPKKLEGLP